MVADVVRAGLGMRAVADDARGTRERELGDAQALAELVAARAPGENFPVALRVLPRREREPLTALYAFARFTDNVGDEADPRDRTRLLDALDADLDRLEAGEPPRTAAVRGLEPLVAGLGVRIGFFRDLVEANRRDQVVHRYRTFAELLDYCRLSANPVGRVVLRIFGADTPERAGLSDLVCTALQLAEHLQDVAEDLAADRVYLPAEDMARFGCSAEDLAAHTASPAVRQLIHYQVRRARWLLNAGAPLVGTLRGTARLAVAGYVAGGRAALDAITAARYDVTGGAPRPRPWRLAAHLVTCAVSGR